MTDDHSFHSSASSSFSPTDSLNNKRKSADDESKKEESARKRDPFDYASVPSTSSSSSSPSPSSSNNPPPSLPLDSGIASTQSSAVGSSASPVEAADLDLLPRPLKEVLDEAVYIQKLYDVFRKDMVDQSMEDLPVSLDDLRLKDVPDVWEEKSKMLAFDLNAHVETMGTYKGTSYRDIEKRTKNKNKVMTFMLGPLFCMGSSHFPFGSAADYMMDPEGAHKFWHKFPNAKDINQAATSIRFSNLTDANDPDGVTLTYKTKAGEEKTKTINKTYTRRLGMIRHFEKHVVRDMFHEFLKNRCRIEQDKKVVTKIYTAVHTLIMSDLAALILPPVNSLGPAIPFDLKRTTEECETKEEREKLTKTRDLYFTQLSEKYNTLTCTEQLNVMDRYVMMILRNTDVFKSSVWQKDDLIGEKHNFSIVPSVLESTVLCLSVTDDVYKTIDVKKKPSALIPTDSTYYHTEMAWIAKMKDMIARKEDISTVKGFKNNRWHNLDIIMFDGFDPVTGEKKFTKLNPWKQPVGWKKLEKKIDEYFWALEYGSKMLNVLAVKLQPNGHKGVCSLKWYLPENLHSLWILTRNSYNSTNTSMADRMITAAQKLSMDPEQINSTKFTVSAGLKTIDAGSSESTSLTTTTKLLFPSKEALMNDSSENQSERKEEHPQDNQTAMET